MAYRDLLAALSLVVTLLFIPLPGSGTYDDGPLPATELSTGLSVIDIDVPSFDISSERIEGRTWSFVHMENAIRPPSDGGPSVPYLSKPLRVDHEIKDIELVRKDPVTIRLPHPLAPTPEVLPLTTEVLSAGATPLVPDLSRYAYGTVYPEEKIRWAHIGYGWDTGERLAHYSVSICPFDHDPGKGTLTYYRSMELKVERSSDPGPARPLEMTRAVDRPADVEEGTELLIIAYDPFVNDLEDYVTWKRERGLTVSIVKYSIVNGAYTGLGGPQSIRTYVHDTYFGDERNLKWVLLAGEPKYVPALMAWDQDPYGNEPSTLPADTYYACLDGDHDDWNRDGDARWVETGDVLDYVPDVYVSRISSDTDAETSRWAAKVIDYERNPPTGDWTRKAALLGSTTHEYDDGPRQCEYLWNSYLDTVYDTPVKLYSAGNVQQSTGASYLTHSNFRSALNTGASAVVYMGHGYHQMWTEGTQQSPSYIMGSDDAYALSQSPKLPFIMAMSCETNWYDNGNWDSISEAFIENPNGGAIGYAGASRTTEGGIGYYQYLPGAPGIQEDFLRMMSDGKRHQGEIFHEGKSHYADEWASWFTTYEFAYNAWVEHNLLGSPETEIWTNTISTFQVEVDHNSDYHSNFTVRVRDGPGNAVQGARVCVYSEKLGVSSVGETNSGGYVTLPFTIYDTAYGKVTVTRRNFKPFQKEYYLEDTTPPETELHYRNPSPDGLSGWYRSDPEIGFSVSEPGNVKYRWNGGTEREFDGPVLVPEGENLLEYWAEDLSGNEEEIIPTTVRFDPNSPVLEYQVEPSSPDGLLDWYNTLPVITTSIIGPEASPHRVDYWWGRGEKKVSNGTIYALQGVNELHLQAVDEAGNRDEEVVIEFKVDSIVPETRMNTGGEEPNEFGWYTSSMEIELACADRTAEIQYRWDGSSDWLRYSSPLEPPQGNNTLHYRSVDPHGNEEPATTLRVPYDTIVPRVMAEITPSAPDGAMGWYITTPSLKLATEDPSPHDIIYYYFDTDPPQVYHRTITIPEGVHSLYVYAVDQAGNRGPTKDIHFKVDTEEEETEVRMDTSPNEEGWLTEVPMVFLSSGEKTIIYYSWEGTSGYTAYNGGILPPGEEGEFLLTYYSMDEAGNRERTRTMSLYIDAKGPETILKGPVEADSGQTLTFDLSASTDGSAIEAYFIDFGDGTDSGWVNSPEMSHSYSEGGTYEVSARTRDIVGHESEEALMTVIVSEQTDTTTIYLLSGLVGLIILAFAVILIALIVSKGRQYRRHHPHHPARPVHPVPPGGHPVRQGMHPVPERGKSVPSRLPPPTPAGSVPGTASYQRPHGASPGTPKAPAGRMGPGKNGNIVSAPPPPPGRPDVPKPPTPPVQR